MHWQCILIFSRYRPQVRCEHHTGSGRRVILADPDFQIVQSETQTKTKRIYREVWEACAYCQAQIPDRHEQDYWMGQVRHLIGLPTKTINYV
jgi:hypothetical protein